MGKALSHSHGTKNIRWNQGHKCYEILLPLDWSLPWDFIQTSTFTSWNFILKLSADSANEPSKSLWTSIFCHMSPHLRHWTFYNLLWPATLIMIFMPNIPLYLDFMPLDPTLDHWAFILRFCMRINEPHTAYSTWVCRFSCCITQIWIIRLSIWGITGNLSYVLEFEIYFRLLWPKSNLVSGSMTFWPLWWVHISWTNFNFL